MSKHDDEKPVNWAEECRKKSIENTAHVSERDYLWRALVDLEIWLKTSPPDWARAAKKVEAALDGFKPVLKNERVMP